MKQFVSTFPQFVNEGYNVNYTQAKPELCLALAKTFSDFNFEEGILDTIQDIEQTWIDIKQKYNWNRENKVIHPNHFAINIKIYEWPVANKMRKILNSPDLGEEEVESLWTHWIGDIRDSFIDSIDFNWVKDVHIGGRSGGWLAIIPATDEKDTLESIDNIGIDYQNDKDSIGSPEEIKVLATYYNDENYQQLADLGLTDSMELVNHLKDEALLVKSGLITLKKEIMNQANDLDRISKQIDRFRKTCVNQFYRYLKEGNF
jgi:hypothetical protein